MGRFFRRGISKIWFVPIIADPNYPPTLAELADGLDLSPQVHAISGFQLSNSPIPVPNLLSTFDETVGGVDSAGTSSLTFYDAKTAATTGTTHPWDIRAALNKGEEGYIVLYPYGMLQSSERWPVQTVSIADMYGLGNDAASFQVTFAVTHTPYKNATSLQAPTNLHAGAILPDSTEIIWNASNAPDFAGYHVYRDGGVTPFEGSILVNPVFFDMDVALGETHTYGVTVYDTNSNESPLSNVISVTTSNDQVPPTQPQNLQVQLI